MNEEKTRFYLAYGSNLNLAQMKMRCPDSKKLGTAILEGYRLAFRGRKDNAYLTVEEAKGFKVPLGIYAVTEADEMQLNDYEGFPILYIKKDMKVRVLETNEVVDAFLYIMNKGFELGMPSPRYQKIVMDGYHDFGFDATPLKEALVG